MVLQSIQDLTLWTKRNSASIGFVPTMGCLHEGHLSLIHEAKKQNDEVIVSIFVNPLQFGKNEDLSSYPRPLERDLQLCQNEGVSAVFCPRVSDLYIQGRTTTVDGGDLAKRYCGKTRPEHFTGVLTVVNILLNLVKPTRAYFGEKDFQQLFLIKQMCRDLWLDVDIVAMPTIRENTGLALSSRNTYLNEEQRQSALCLHSAILKTQQAAQSDHRCTAQLRSLASQIIQTTPDVTLDYAHIVDEKTLQPVGDVVTRHARLLLAAFIGDSPRIRLIDNGALL